MCFCMLKLMDYIHDSIECVFSSTKIKFCSGEAIIIMYASVLDFVIIQFTNVRDCLCVMCNCL